MFGHQSNLLSDTQAGLGKVGELSNPYLGMGMVVRPSFRVGTVVHLYRV
jgi:hypothetical protein